MCTSESIGLAVIWSQTPSQTLIILESAVPCVEINSVLDFALGRACAASVTFSCSVGCRAWLWRSDQDHCWLKDTIPRPILCPECIGGIFHHGTAICINQTPQRVTFCSVMSSNPEICTAQEGSGWDGQNLEVRIGTTLGDCCDACNQSLSNLYRSEFVFPNNSSDCTRWSFRNTTNPRCFLKRGNAQETNCTNCISGRNGNPFSNLVSAAFNISLWIEENIRLDERRCNVVTGVDWFQNDMNTEPYENTTMSECCEMCQNTPGQNPTGTFQIVILLRVECRAWLFRRRWRHCYLKDAIGSEQTCRDCIGGILQWKKIF